MKPALIVFWKEVRENLRDRRTVINTLVTGPLMGPLMFVLMMHTLVTRVELDRGGTAAAAAHRRSRIRAESGCGAQATKRGGEAAAGGCRARRARSRTPTSYCVCRRIFTLHRGKRENRHKWKSSTTARSATPTARSRACAACSIASAASRRARCVWLPRAVLRLRWCDR